MTKTKAIVLTAMFSALVFIFTAYFLHIPIGGGGGYIHFGDTFIFLAASLLPFPYGLFVGAIGASLADFLTGAAVWVPFTVVIKSLMALCFTSKTTKLLGNKRNLAAPVLAGIICLAGYYLAEAVISGNILSPMASVPGGLIQFFGSAVFYYLFAGVIDSRHLKEQLFQTPTL